MKLEKRSFLKDFLKVGLYVLPMVAIGKAISLVAEKLGEA